MKQKYHSKSKYKELNEFHEEILKVSKEFGLEPFDTVFYSVDYNTLHELASKSGFPRRYPFWLWGQEFERVIKPYTYGLSRIYEMVINTDPCYAYLLDANQEIDQKIVIAHVYGHSDFFANNQWFSKTNRRMLEEMGNHREEVIDIIKKEGYLKVEEFLDGCHTLDNLIDIHSDSIKRRDIKKAAEEEVIDEEIKLIRVPRMGYMNDFINTPELIDKQKEAIKKKKEIRKEKEREGIVIPREGIRDILGFLIGHGALEDWQRKILSIAREESYYFYPQGLTKVMNEGWAAYWQEKILVDKLLISKEEVSKYADHAAGVLSSPGLNPYQLGISLWKYIEDYFNRGKDSLEYKECKDRLKKENWGKDIADKIAEMPIEEQMNTRGRQKMFEIREVYNDATFIREFFTKEFCQEYMFFNWKVSDDQKWIILDDREYEKIKERLIDIVSHYDTPEIVILDSNYGKKGELYLKHKFREVPLKRDWMVDAMKNLYHIWGKKVNLETSIPDIPPGNGFLISYDGKDFKVEEIKIPPCGRTGGVEGKCDGFCENHG